MERRAREEPPQPGRRVAHAKAERRAPRGATRDRRDDDDAARAALPLEVEELEPGAEAAPGDDARDAARARRRRRPELGAGVRKRRLRDAEPADDPVALDHP